MAQEAKIKKFDLEEHVKGKEETGKKDEEAAKEDKTKLTEKEKEELKEILEEGGESIMSQRINHFLANQQREVSLEKNDFVINNLEEDLPPIKKEENEEENIEYMIKNEIEEGMYNPGIKQEGHFVDLNQSKDTLLKSQQREIYSEAQKMSDENRQEKSSGLDAQIKYTTVQDTKKKNDLAKKKFY